MLSRPSIFFVQIVILLEHVPDVFAMLWQQFETATDQRCHIRTGWLAHDVHSPNGRQDLSKSPTIFALRERRGLDMSQRIEERQVQCISFDTLLWRAKRR